MAERGVYWRGADGNTYVKAAGLSGGVQRWAPGWDQDQRRVDIINSLTRIDDPNGPKPQQTPTANRTVANSNGGSGSAGPALNEAAVSNTQKAIDSLGTEEAVGLKSIDDSFNSLMTKYGNEAARNEADYQEGGVTNNQNFAKNKQNALLAAAQGRRGLRGTLSSIGALSGDGAALADRVVTEGANDDIGGATETATTNATMLDKAIGNFRDEDKERRAEAETARNNSRTALEGSILSKRQQFYQKMAELFGGADRTAEASTWLNRAGDLNTPIAQKSAVQATPIQARSAAFTPGELENYLAGAGDMTVSTAPAANGGAGSPMTILAGRRRKREEMAA